jgi:hypothetical protein
MEETNCFHLSLYGVNISGATLGVHFDRTTTDFDFKPCQANPDVWMQPAV